MLFYNDICHLCAPVAMAIQRLLFVKSITTKDDFSLCATVPTCSVKWLLLVK